MKEFFLNPVFAGLVSLILVVYFSLLFLALNNKSKVEKADSAFIIFFLFITTNTQLEPFRLLRPENLYAADKQLEIVFIQVMIYVAFLLLLRNQYKKLPYYLLFLFTMPCTGFFLFLLLISFSWSETRGITLGGSLVVVFLSAVSVHIARKYNWSELLKLICYSNGLVTILSIPTALFLPSLGRNGKGWLGIVSHPIDFGSFMAFGSIIWILYSMQFRKKWLPASFSALSFVLMILSSSTGAIVIFSALFFSLLFIHFLQKLELRPTVIAIVLALSTCTAFLPFYNVVYTSILTIFGKDASLTGRAEIWPQVWSAAMNKPILGYGFLGFWQPWRGSENPASGIVNSNLYVPPHAHNGFLEVLLALGFLGLMTFSLSLLSNVYQAVKIASFNKDKSSLLSLLFIMYLIILNFNQSALLLPRYVWVYYIIISAKLYLEKPNGKPRKVRFSWF